MPTLLSSAVVYLPVVCHVIYSLLLLVPVIYFILPISSCSHFWPQCLPVLASCLGLTEEYHAVVLTYNLPMKKGQ